MSDVLQVFRVYLATLQHHLPTTPAEAAMQAVQQVSPWYHGHRDTLAPEAARLRVTLKKLLRETDQHVAVLGDPQRSLAHATMHELEDRCDEADETQKSVYMPATPSVGLKVGGKRVIV